MRPPSRLAADPGRFHTGHKQLRRTSDSPLVDVIGDLGHETRKSWQE